MVLSRRSCLSAISGRRRRWLWRLWRWSFKGGSTRRVKNVTTELCGREFSKSTVSQLTKKLDEQVKAWAERPLKGEYPFPILDAVHVKVRRQGGGRSTAVFLAFGINEEGQREILGLRVAPSETEEA